MGAACCTDDSPFGSNVVVSVASNSKAKGNVTMPPNQLEKDPNWQLENTVSFWKVVFGTRFPVHSERTGDIRKMTGMKKNGDIVRGYPEGDWLVLVDEPGFMRLAAASSGATVVARIEDGDAILPPLVNEEAQAEEPPNVQVSDEICNWLVVYKMRFPVMSEMAMTATFLGTKKPGEIIRGREAGDWVVLVDEPGYMRIKAVGTGKVVLAKQNEDEPQLPGELAPELSATSSTNVPLLEKSTEGPTDAGSPPGQRKTVKAEIISGSFLVVIETKDTSQKLGIDCQSVSVAGRPGLRIKSIKDGLISQWNDKHPGQGLRVGDIIIEVNGTQGDAPELYGAVIQYMEAKQLLCMSIMRDGGDVVETKRKSRDESASARPDNTKEANSTDVGVSHEQSASGHELRLLFRRVDGSQREVKLAKRPLGLDFTMSNPMQVKRVTVGGLSDRLGIQAGWLVVAVNGEDVAEYGFEQTYTKLRVLTSHLPE